MFYRIICPDKVTCKAYCESVTVLDFDARFPGYSIHEGRPAILTEDHKGRREHQFLGTVIQDPPILNRCCDWLFHVQLTAEQVAAYYNRFKEETKPATEHALTFEWTDDRTTAADNMIMTFKAAGIRWQYGHYFNLQAVLNGRDMVTVDYYHITDDTYGIAEKSAVRSAC